MARHWAESYVGQPYIKRDNDCAALAAKVQREVFNRNVRLPTERAMYGLGYAEQIDTLKANYACRIESPQEGDAVLMICKGRPSHIGVYCVIQGEPWVLHAVRNAGQVILTRLRELEINCLGVEGYYRWI